MHVVLMVVGDVVVHDQDQILDIKTSGSDTSSHQNRANVTLEI
jgi:hypothetical protein